MITTYTTTTSQLPVNQWQMLAHKIKASIKRPKVVIGLALALIVTVALGLSIYQSQKSQENRSSAHQSDASLTPSISLDISDTARSHDQDPQATGLQLTTGNQGTIDLKLAPNGLKIVGAEVFVSFNPTKVEIVQQKANASVFTGFANFKLVGNNQLRLLVLVEPGPPLSIPSASQTVNLGNIQLKLKPGVTAANIVFTKANFIIDDQDSPVRSVANLAGDPTVALNQHHLLPIELADTHATIVPTDTPAVPPTGRPSPTPVVNLPDVTVDGQLVTDSTTFDQAGNLHITYHLTATTPNDWQVNVIAVPSTQASAPLASDRRVKSNDCKDVQPNQSCRIIIPQVLLNGQTKVFVFANQFKSYNQKKYYCSWSNGGQWIVTDLQDHILTGITPTSHCTNTSLVTLPATNAPTATLTPTSTPTSTPTTAASTPTPTAFRQPPSPPDGRANVSPSPTFGMAASHAGPGLTDRVTIDPQVMVNQIINQTYQSDFDLNQDHRLDLKDFTVWWQQS